MPGLRRIIEAILGMLQDLEAEISCINPMDGRFCSVANALESMTGKDLKGYLE
jgi:hypothetical protein